MKKSGVHGPENQDPSPAAGALPDGEHRLFQANALLEAVTQGTDVIIAAQDKEGLWEFLKKDGSTWGQTAQPWTYSRWIRAFALIKDAMPKTPESKNKGQSVSTDAGGPSETLLTSADERLLARQSPLIAEPLDIPSSHFTLHDSPCPVVTSKLNAYFD